MGNEEKRSNENKSAGKGPDMSCCGPRGISEMMTECCESMSESRDWRSMMGQCMKGCRWFPLIPVILGAAFFLLGYYLDAEITRILWLVVSGFMILLGTFGFIMMSLMSKK